MRSELARRYTEKNTVTAHERLQLIGLLTLAERHNKALREIEAAVMEIVGEQETGGHAGDAVYSDFDADMLLGKLELAVSDNLSEASTDDRRGVAPE